MRYVCVHYVDDYLRATLERACQIPDGNGVRVVKVYPDLGRGDTLICEVEAPTPEGFLCWITEVNAKSKRESLQPVEGPKASQ